MSLPLVHEPYAMTAVVRSGCVAANSSDIAAVSEMPMMAALLDPAASITATMSLTRSSSSGARSPGSRSDMPVPRLSKTISLEKDASRRRNRARAGSSHECSRWETNPGARTRSSGASPTTW